MFDLNLFGKSWFRVCRGTISRYLIRFVHPSCCLPLLMFNHQCFLPYLTVPKRLNISIYHHPHRHRHLRLHTALVILVHTFPSFPFLFVITMYVHEEHGVRM